MAAVSADQTSIARKLDQCTEEVAAIATGSTVYVGTLLNFNTAGRVVSASAAANRRFAGECIEILNDSGSAIAAGTGNAGGTIKAKFRYGHQMRLNVLTAARTYTNLGKSVVIGDNVSVTDSSGAGTAGVRVVCGQLVSFDNTAKSIAWVWLRGQGDTAAT